jgi:hypothetical protein
MVQEKESCMAAQIVLFDPTASSATAATAAQRTLSALAGKVVGFIDNTKPNFQYLADDIGELLVGRYGVAGVMRHQKRNASVAAAADVIASFSERCDVVIAGSGD